MTHAGGRPTKYNDTMIAKVGDYLSIYQTLGDVIPSVAGFAIFVGVSKSTVNLWALENDEFSVALKDIHTKQEQVTLNGALINEYNSTISKLILHNHGYSDKTESEVTHAGKINHQVKIGFIGVDETDA